MSTQPPKSASKPPSRSSSSLSTHLAMVEFKQRIITSLSKLADRDTHQIALEDLHSIIQSLTPESLPLLLNSLYDALSDSSNSKSIVKKEALDFFSVVCESYRDFVMPHLGKIVACVVRRLKDSDSGVRDACRDAFGVFSRVYLNGSGDGANVGLFVKPLFEAMSEQNKGVQSGAAICMAKMVESAAGEDGNGVPVVAFQKMCPRICKLLSGQIFQAKAALLAVVSSLSQVGAIAPQCFDSLLQSIHDCLKSTDWATRKAAADSLSAVALHSRSLITDGASNSTLAVLEACRFDKIKPARDSMTEALQSWKKIAGKGYGTSEEQKTSSSEVDNPEKSELSKKTTDPSEQKKESLARDSSGGSSPDKDSASKGKGGSISEKAVVILKKKVSSLSDKEINPEFFQKLQTRGPGDLVEVVVPRRCLNNPNQNNEEGSEIKYSDSRSRSNCIGSSQSEDSAFFNKRGNTGKDSRTRTLDDERFDANHRELSSSRAAFSKFDGQSEGSFSSNKGSWLAIQRQLLQLERQQTYLMNMLQDFMGGSHDSVVILEHRVRGLERVVEDMARDLSLSSGRRNNSFGMPLGKYNSFADYSSGKFNGPGPFGGRLVQSDVSSSGMRSRGPNWRSDAPDAWEAPPAYGASRSGQTASRKALGGGSTDVRSPKSEHETDQPGSRRAWEKGAGPARLGEGPSARSVWQASMDEATLEAIRVAGEDTGFSRTARVAIPEMTAEAMTDDNVGQDRDPIWASWSSAMDALKMGDIDSAYAEVLSTGDDFLLVKLMDRSGPVFDQLSNETTTEVLQAIGQFLMEQNLYDICLSWIQQLVEIAMESDSLALRIPVELKKDILLNLHEASTTMEPLEDWEGPAPDQLLLQLAAAWGIELQQFEK